MVTLLWLTGKTVVQLTIEKGDDEVGGEPRKTAAIQVSLQELEESHFPPILHFSSFTSFSFQQHSLSPPRLPEKGRFKLSFSEAEDVNARFGFDSRTNDYKLLIVGADGADDDGYHRRNNGRFRNTILGFDLSAKEFFEISLPKSSVGLDPMNLSTKKYGKSSIAILRRESGYIQTQLGEWWVMKEEWGSFVACGYNGKMASLDFNSQQLEPHGIEVATGTISFRGSYVESLVLFDKVVDVHSGCHRSDDKRKGYVGTCRGMIEVVDFIEEMGLLDLLISKKKLTWFGPGGNVADCEFVMHELFLLVCEMERLVSHSYED
ncbi:hypothetical protein V6N11_079250 [Hibiscus sabdariffa]|uniref:Uncharacterized protein n=1 Tax=Hibiscus sabdariffa TaxID=183260 RepID=A0ABR2RUY9_9ROSI